MHLVSAKNCYEFDHSLFTVEVDGDAKEFKTDIEYEQLVLLKHRISNKYLSFCS